MKPYDLVRRHVAVNGKDTTVQLERLYWIAIDTLAKRENQPSGKLLQRFISLKPAEYNSCAGWIRYCATYRILHGLINDKKAAAQKVS